MFENPRRGRQAKLSKKFYNKCSENSRSQIVFRTDIFPKIAVGCPWRRSQIDSTVSCEYMNYCVCCLKSLRILVALECLGRNFSENCMKEKGAKIFESELQYRLVEFKCLQSPKERSSVLITKTQLETSFYMVLFDTETFVLCMTEWTSVRRTFADAVFLSELFKHMLLRITTRVHEAKSLKSSLPL